MDEFFIKENCDRCGKKLTTRIMSRFNKDTICKECEEKEKKHPLYKQACDAELKAIKQGNYNFVGIGKPADL